MRRSEPYDQECSKQVAWRSHAICLANGGAYGYGGEFTLNNNIYSRHVACGSAVTYYFQRELWVRVGNLGVVQTCANLLSSSHSDRILFYFSIILFEMV